MATTTMATSQPGAAFAANMDHLPPPAAAEPITDESWKQQTSAWSVGQEVFVKPRLWAG